MTFANIKNNQASEKINLVRIVPARYVNSDLSLDSGTLYNMTFPFFIQKVVENGTTLTKVSSSPSAGEWAFNESTKLLEVNTTTGIAATNPIIVYYYIFLTNDINRVVSEDPEDSNTGLRDWEPLVKNVPSVKQSMRDILKGTMSISATRLSLINLGSQFNKYLTPNDSFNKKEVKMWQALDSVENIQKIYEGVTTNLEINRSECSIEVQDTFQRLNQPAYFGDREDDVFYSKSYFPNVDPNQEGRPVPIFFGPLTRHRYQYQSGVGGSNPRKLVHDKVQPAVNISYSTTVSTSNNRTWSIGRTNSDGVVNLGSTILAVNHPPGQTELTLSIADAAKYYVGDTFRVDSSGGTHYCRVTDITYNVGILDVIREPAITATAASIIDNKVPSIVIRDTNTQTSYYPLYERDYTATETTTSYGNKYYEITFTASMETNLSMPTLDPSIHTVGFRIHPDTSNHAHGSFVKSLLEAAGVTVNAASITAANAALSTNAAFSIPYFDETNFSNYLKYMEDFLSSTLGYLSLNNSFEVEYSLFSTPSTTTEMTDDDILRDTFNIKLEYKDIVTQFICFNPHLSSTDFNDDTSDTREDAKARLLHDVDNTDRFRHLLDDITVRIDALFNVRKERLALYNFSNKIQTIDSIIGSEFQLTKGSLLGSDTERDITILELSKSATATRVVATDLLGL